MIFLLDDENNSSVSETSIFGSEYLLFSAVFFLSPAGPSFSRIEQNSSNLFKNNYQIQ